MISSIASPGLLLADDESGGGGGTNPGISPDMSAPWIQNFMQEFGGQLVATAIVFIGIGMAVALVIWVAGSWGNSSSAQGAGVKGLIICVAAAIVAGSIGGAITWFSGWSLF